MAVFCPYVGARTIAAAKTLPYASHELLDDLRVYNAQLAAAHQAPHAHTHTIGICLQCTQHTQTMAVPTAAIEGVAGAIGAVISLTATYPLLTVRERSERGFLLGVRTSLSTSGQGEAPARHSACANVVCVCCARECVCGVGVGACGKPRRRESGGAPTRRQAASLRGTPPSARNGCCVERARRSQPKALDGGT